MKIRLKITTPAGTASTLFEHSGPIVRIGRHPDCELLLEGEAATASRHHALIELSPKGAFLSDTASGNGTLHNDRIIDQPVALRLGDRIRIGQTGSTLVVVSLELPATATASQKRLTPSLILAALGAITGLFLMCAVVFWPGVPTPAPRKTVAGGKKDEQDPIVSPSPPSSRIDRLPSLDIKPVGHYLRQEKARPSLLLQRSGENHPWTVLRSGQAVSSATTLVSLPGYQSLVAFDCGVSLLLWGNLPEFAPFPPLLESVVMLNAPTTGTDADLTLDRGRIQIAGAPSGGPRKVRLRFLREVWDIVLTDADSKVCAELWHRPALNSTAAVRYLGLFSRGKVIVKTGRKQLHFSGLTRLVWSAAAPTHLFEGKLVAVPDWWDKPPPASERAQDAMLSLNDWAVKYLDRSPDVVDTILTQIRESNDRTDRMLGLLFLAALDEAAHLVEFLEDKDPRYPDIRTTAMLGLQDWLGRSGHRRDHLTRLIQERRGIAATSAALIVSLLSPLSAKACEDPATYQELIEHLNHDKLAVRHLAAWHLYSALAHRMPREALGIDYNPVEESEKRLEAIAQWRKVIPPKSVPRRTVKKGS